MSKVHNTTRPNYCGQQSDGRQHSALVTKLINIAAVNTVRKIINLFKKSPTRNDKLQTYIMKDYNKNLVLIGDVKTRWNSLLQMVDRFLLLQNCVKKLLLIVTLNSN